MENLFQNQSLRNQLEILANALFEVECDLRECESMVGFELLLMALSHIRRSLEELA